MLTSWGGANMATIHSWLNTQPDKVSQFFIHVLSQRFHFTHIYIPFILSLFNCIQNNELWCIELIWFLYLQSCKKQWTVSTTWFTPVFNQWSCELEDYCYNKLTIRHLLQPFHNNMLYFISTNISSMFLLRMVEAEVNVLR